MLKTPRVADDVTVTTATRSEDEVRESLGADKPKADDGKPPATSDDKKPDAEAAKQQAIEKEADSQRPDPEVSDAARTLRSSRLDTKLKRLREDATLYADALRELGATVPQPSAKQFNNPQHEIDVLTRYRHDLIDATSKHLKAKKSAPKPAAPAAPKAAAPAAAADAPKPAEKKFEFATWEQYQEKHPEAEYTDYIDERNDAREAFKAAQKVEQEKAAETAKTAETQQADDEQAVAELMARTEADEATFATDHADYKDVTAPFMEHVGKGLQAKDPRADAFLKEARAGRIDPALWYFLAKNPADVNRLFDSQNLPQFHQILGEVRYAAKQASAVVAKPAGEPAAAAAAAAAPKPAKPSTDAPEPISVVPGSASSPVRSAAQISEDDGEDADNYIARRREELGQKQPPVRRPA